MKKIIFNALVTISISLVVTCSREGLHESEPLQPNTKLATMLTPAVGDPMAPDLAANWIRAFRKNPASASAVATYDISSETIKQLLTVKYAGQPVDGLRFIKGINDSDEETLIVIPVQGGNDLWYLSYAGSPERINDKGTAYDRDGPVDITTAKKWVEAFRGRNPSSNIHRSYFVGYEALRQIVDTLYKGETASGLRFYKALNGDLKETFVIAPVQDDQTLGVLEFLLSGSNAKSLRTADEVVYIEYMMPCPSTCPE